ncbi:hypothetical protein DMN91_000483 [Ooceraea biroi]|uniref:Putative nuclease HARBI1 n=1 Tax=Ooceraea biroi TaxID=2015173 RepID=A0A3L8E222_OOCBI|nr:hypothetical protein DMN91_000483 [Ooceraea biroi]
MRCLLEYNEILLSSTSSESDEDLIDVINIIDENENCPRRKNPRVQNFIENVIYEYNDTEFRENFRLTRTTFNYLLYILREELEGESNLGNVTIPAEKQLYIALYVLGIPDSYRSIVTKFDVGKATAWRAVQRVVHVLCNYRNHFIRWPNEREANECSRVLQMQYGFPGVIGALDGTHINISTPAQDSQSYINWKGKHSIQLQVVCNHKLQFVHCYTGLPGSVHDMRVFKYSGLQQRCNDNYFQNNTHIIADSAYTL